MSPLQPKAVSADPSRRSASPPGFGCLVAFFAVFFLVGGAATYALFVRPLMAVWDARTWVAVPCHVVSSQVRRFAGDDGDTFRVEIEFAYEFEKRPYRSQTYDFSVGSSSGKSRKQAVVDRHPPGLKTTCFVDPRDPTRAVLSRDLPAGLWIGLVPLVFVAVGAAGAGWSLRKWRLQRAEADPSGPLRTAVAEPTRLEPSRLEPARLFDEPPARHEPSGRKPQFQDETPTQDEPTSQNTVGDATRPPAGRPVRLPPSSSPRGKFLAILAVTLFWNGIVSVFVTIAVSELRQGKPNWFLMVFLIPFVTVGLLLVWGVVHSFLALFNPRPTLVVNTTAVQLGFPLEVAWQFAGAAHSIRHLRIYLEGKEEATYRRGTSTSTDSSVFARLPIVDATDIATIAQGRGELTVPFGTMHSWTGGHNKIVWALRLTGEIPRWPDVDETYPIQVLPVSLS